MEYLVGEDLLETEFDTNYETEMVGNHPWQIEHLIKFLIGLMRDHKEQAEVKLTMRKRNLLQYTSSGWLSDVAQLLSKESIHGGISSMNGNSVHNMFWNKGWCFIEDEDLQIITDEWNPMTFAIYIGN